MGHGSVGVRGGEGVWAEAVEAAERTGAGSAGGFDVDVRVADHDGFVELDLGLADEGEEAFGIGLFGGEGVSTVVLEEEAVEAEVCADGSAGHDGFVGEDGHGEIGTALADGGEGFKNTWIEGGEIQLVDLVVGDKPVQGFVDEGVVVRVGFVVDEVGVGERAADERGGSVADVGGDGFRVEFGFAEVLESRVDGVGEIDLGVDEGSIEVEDEETGCEHLK